jgi:ArsR family metal-binding transcriptional regulator
MSDVKDPQSGMQTLIADYRLELISPPCLPGAETWSARASLDREIDAVMPYLNAQLKGADYDHETKILVWKDEGHSFAFRSREIKAAPARDREEARKLVDRAVALVNETWRGRESIEPRYEKRNVPNLMQIYRLLPRSNCGKCGFPTCMSFAAMLLEAKTELDRCAALEQPVYSDSRDALQALLNLARD